LILLALGGHNMRGIEALVLVMMAVIFVCFSIEMYFSQPDGWLILQGALVPSSQLLTDQNMLLVSIGILGATVMPHNLYLHSSLVQTRDIPSDARTVRRSIFLATVDSNMALSLAFLVNMAILILAAATFHRAGHPEVADIEQAYIMLSRILGNKTASVLFAVALLASGQQSTLTGTLAGQIVMEGFVNWKITAWKRRLMTRLVAIIPAICVVYFYGDSGVTPLLIASQVVLSLQLSFAVFPLVYLTSDEGVMKGFANCYATKLIGWVVAVAIAALNMLLIVLTFRGDV